MLFILKALHIIGFVSWFAGLFYLGRMFVYFAEAENMPQPESVILKKQFILMQWRVFRLICNPGLVITFAAGGGILVLYPLYLQMEWMYVKIGLLLLLLVFHFYCRAIIKKQEAGRPTFSSFQFRLLNEVPTLFLVAITFIAVLGKAGNLNYWYLTVGMLVFTGLLYLGARAYKKAREKKAF